MAPTSPAAASAAIPRKGGGGGGYRPRLMHAQVSCVNNSAEQAEFGFGFGNREARLQRTEGEDLVPQKDEGASMLQLAAKVLGFCDFPFSLKSS